MKRLWSVALTSALIAGSITLAAPANAQVNCQLGPLPPQTIIDTSGPVVIYAGNAPGYLLAVAAVATNYANCLRAALVNPVVSCVKQLAPVMPLVEVDVTTLTVTIHTENIIGDDRCIAIQP
ncbi:MAG TPA: hypothetical protein VG318_00870 [Actinomycetota bacterium]|nr:hypothetical protein [Actinomycetota bacterium]